MAIELILVPCELGREGAGMGAGPLARERGALPVVLTGNYDTQQAVAAGRVSLHIDLDVLDPSFGRANQYAVPPGISPDELLDAVRAVRPRLAAVTLSAYDPAFDPDGAVRDAAPAVLGQCAS
jgi:arginase family enzyme